MKLHLKTVQTFITLLLIGCVQAITLSGQTGSEWRSAASGTYDNAGGTIWERKDAVSGVWTLQAAATRPSGGASVTIRTGHTVSLITLGTSSTTSILSLTIENGGILNSSAAGTAVFTLRVGTSASGGATDNVVTIQNDGVLGSTTGANDGIVLEMSPNCKTLTLQGTGTTKIARFRTLYPNPNATATFNVDQNMDLVINNNTGFTGYYNNAANTTTENYVINILAGRTVKLYAGGYFHGSVGATPPANAQGTVTYNIYGILDLSATTTGGLQTSTNIGASSSLNLNIKNGGLMKLGTKFGAIKGTAAGSINMIIENGGVVDGSLLPSGIDNFSSTLNTGYTWFVTQGTGYLKQTIASTSVNFPVGTNATSYNPVTLTNGGGQLFSVNVTTGNTPAGLTDPTKALNRTWGIVPSTLPATADITFGYNAGEGNANCVLTDPMQLQNFGTTAWTLLGTATPSVPSSGGTGFQVGYSGILSFGAFNLVSQPTIPVELVSFTGKKNNKFNELTWVTASELDNKGYQIERSQGLENNWQAIGFVSGKGKAASYSFQDENAIGTSTFYYRLRQMDISGKETVSKVIAISENIKTKLNVYPSVTTGLLTVDAAENSVFQIVNLLGQTVLSGKMATQRLDVSILPKGTYLLKVGDEQMKFIKQ